MLEADLLLDDILKYATKLVWLVRTKLNNTKTQPASLQEACSGLIPLCGHDATITYEDDSLVSFSSGPVPGEETDEVISGFITKGMRIPAAWTPELASRSYGGLTLEFPTENHGLMDRLFRDAPVEVLVDGLVHEGTPDEQLLDVSEYATYLDGKIFNDSKNQNVVELSLQLDSGELQAEFPPNSFSSGDSEGQARPIKYNTPRGTAPKRIEPGLFLFSDAPVVTSDFVWSAPPVVHFENGKDFSPFNDITTIVYPAADDSGYTTYSAAAFDWSQDDDTTISVVSPLDVSATIEGDGLTITAADDGVFTVERTDAARIETFLSHQFDWQAESATTLKNLRDPQVEVTLGAGVDFHSVGGRWFKITADNDSGTVTLGF